VGKTQLTFQPDLSGGLDVTTDIFKTRPNAWSVAKNFMVGRPGGDVSGNPSWAGAAVTAPPMRNPPVDNSRPVYSYPSSIPKRFAIAHCDSRENWDFSDSTVYFKNNPISQYNDCINVDIQVGSPNTATLIFASPLDISGQYSNSDWVLKLDTYWTGGTSPNVKFLNSNSANFANYILQTFAMPFSLVRNFVFDTTGGSFDPTAVTSIEFTFPIGGTILRFSDLRFEHVSESGFITNVLQFGQGATASAPGGQSFANTTGISVIAGCQDMVLVGTYPFSYWLKIMVGFTQTSILDSPTGTNYYFAQYPNPNDPAQNFATLMSGADLVYQFKPNTNPQLSRVLAGLSEVQTLTLAGTPTSGDFKLTFIGQTTGTIAYNASASDIQTALEALSTIGTGNVVVTGSLATSIVITFAGTLGNVDQPIIAVTDNALLITGTAVTFSITYGGSIPPQVQTFIPNQPAISGDFQLSYRGNLTSVLPYNASASDIQTALNALPDAGNGNLNVTVTGDIATGFTIYLADYVISHMVNTGAAASTRYISVQNNTMDGAGSGVTVTIVETTKGDPGPTYRYQWTYKNMLFFAGNPLQPFSVAPSNVDDFTIFLAQNIIVVKSATSTHVTGGWDMDDYCIISTDTDIYNLFGSNSDSATGDFDLKRSKSKVGVIEQAAAVRIGPGLYFYSGEDIYAYNGVDSISITDSKIQQYLDNVPEGLRRAVTMTYNLERNVLLVQLPQPSSQPSVDANNYWITLTYSLKYRAWGEIEPTSISDIQQISLSDNPDEGSVRYTFKGQTTPTIPYNNYGIAPTYLENLSTIGAGNATLTEVGPFAPIIVSFKGYLGGVKQPLITVFSNSLKKNGSPITITITKIVDGGPTSAMICGLNMPSDGSESRTVFFQFGNNVLEWDCAAGEETITRSSLLQLAFNHMKSPSIQKDFMRYILNVRKVGSLTSSQISMYFFSNGNDSTPRQTLVGLQSSNGKLDTFVNGVSGDNLGVAFTIAGLRLGTDVHELSGYLAYWQAMEEIDG